MTPLIKAAASEALPGMPDMPDMPDLRGLSTTGRTPAAAIRQLHHYAYRAGDDEAALPSLNTPLWVNHIAFRIDRVDDLLAMKARLEAAGVEVLGITNHHIIKSIYFFDPNGVRLELTVQLADELEMHRAARRPMRGRMDGPPRAVARATP